MYHIADLCVSPHVLLAAVSFEDDKFVVSSSKSPTLLVGSIQSDPGLKVGNYGFTSYRTSLFIPLPALASQQWLLRWT
jgi:hypothetical protein